jgi:Na+-translocating ferredoxin:NAD+ oxidoreductase subunit C
LTAHGLFDCIECGCCDLVCPSHIPLVEHFRFGKNALRVSEQDAAAAAAARARFEARERRLERERAERAAKSAARRGASADALQAALRKARTQAGGEPE